MSGSVEIAMAEARSQQHSKAKRFLNRSVRKEVTNDDK